MVGSRRGESERGPDRVDSSAADTLGARQQNTAPYPPMRPTVPDRIAQETGTATLPPALDRLFRQGIAAQQAGDFEQARTHYLEVLTWVPDHADSLHLTGLSYVQSGRPEQALGPVGTAIRLQPNRAEYYDSLGLALKALGRLPEAIEALQQAVRLKPGLFGAQYNLGNALYAAGRHEDAAARYRRAIKARPDDYGAHNNLGNAYRALRQPERAAQAFRAALRLRPGVPELMFNLACVLAEADKHDEALASVDAVLLAVPEHAPAHRLRGELLEKCGDFDAAAAAFAEALRHAAMDASVMNTLASAIYRLGRLTEAEKLLREAVRLRPDAANAWNNLGLVLQDLGEMEEARLCLDRALTLDPADHGARYNRALLHLTEGRLVEGWADHESRFAALNFVPRRSGPEWAGEAAPERVLLIHPEQGSGDFIQFCRYATLAAARMRVVLEAPAPLLRLMGTLAGPGRVVASELPPPPFDLQCPVMTLPRVFATTLQTVPADIPYLRADAAQAAAWKQRLAALPGRRIGLAWAGSPAYLQDQARSIPPALLAPLAGVAGVSWVSLQKGKAPPRAGIGAVLHDWSGELADFADTAALIEALDLVVSVDTAVVHLAGALGRQVWLLNRFDTDWRWLRGRDDSPWYPTLRQFRQPAPGDWASVVARVGDALAAFAAG